MPKVEYAYRPSSEPKAPLVKRPPGRPRGMTDRHGHALRVAPGAEIPVMRAFAEHLRYVREEADIAVAELAAALGVENNTVHGWESGRTRPHLHTLIRIAMALGVPLDHLIPEV